MLLKLTKIIGKPICIALYGYFSYLASKKKYVPLILLVALHTSEYFAIGKKVGKDNGLNPFATVLLCLSFGFTWWLPIKK